MEHLIPFQQLLLQSLSEGTMIFPATMKFCIYTIKDRLDNNTIVPVLSMTLLLYRCRVSRVIVQARQKCITSLFQVYTEVAFCLG